jgi:hypothetical protein
VQYNGFYLVDPISRQCPKTADALTLEYRKPFSYKNEQWFVVNLFSSDLSLSFLNDTVYTKNILITPEVISNSLISYLTPKIITHFRLLKCWQRFEIFHYLSKVSNHLIVANLHASETILPIKSILEKRPF